MFFFFVFYLGHLNCLVVCNNAGICHAHYSHYNVSPDARVALRRLFEVLAFLCELFVFAYLGLQVPSKSHSFDFGLFFSGIPLAVLSRAANVFPCSQLINTYRDRKFPYRLQRMLWAVGLRGAVAYGLLVNMPRSDTPGQVGIPAIETAALLIVVVSTLVLGSATEPLLRHLDLEGRSDEEIYVTGWAEYGAPGQPQPPSQTSHFDLHDRFKDLDESILKPLFGGRHENEEEDDCGLDMDEEQEIDFGGEGPTLRRPLFNDPATTHFGFDYNRNERVDGQPATNNGTRVGDGIVSTGAGDSEVGATPNEHSASTQHVPEEHNDIKDII